jgi:hypothetical protein
MDEDGRDAKESEVANRIGFAYPSIGSIREKTDMPVISFAFNRAGMASLSDPKTHELTL